MSNAYFLYFGPLAISAIFVCGGVGVLRRHAQRKRDHDGREYGASAVSVGALLTLIGGGVGLAILFNSPTPWQRRALFAHIFHTPPAQIVNVTLEGNSRLYKPLITREIIITDRQMIQEIASALSAARDCAPNHPLSDWTVRVKLTTTQGEFSFSVSATSNGNGTLASVGSMRDGGWNLGDFRVDALRPVLERAAAAAAAANAAN